jgi:hypothetical protein
MSNHCDYDALLMRSGLHTRFQTDGNQAPYPVTFATEQRSGHTTWHDKYTPEIARICSTAKHDGKWKTDERLYQIHASMASQLRYTIQHLHYVGACARTIIPTNTFFANRIFQLTEYIMGIYDLCVGEADRVRLILRFDVATATAVSNHQQATRDIDVGRGSAILVKKLQLAKTKAWSREAAKLLLDGKSSNNSKRSNSNPSTSNSRGPASDQPCKNKAAGKACFKTPCPFKH